MKKISYRSQPKSFKIPLSGELPPVGISQSSREKENGGSFGMIFPGTIEGTHKLPDSEISTSDYIKMMEDFVSMADNLDDNNLTSEANFIDFLIQKFAETKKIEVSEEERYIEYMYKIHNSDIPNSIEKIKNLTLKYSNKVNELISSGVDKNSAKNRAFETELLMEKL